LFDSQCIDTVVLAGLYTSGVILSTTRQLADMDYSIYIIRDAVIDPNSTVSEVLLDSVFPNQATVLTVSAAKNMLQIDHEQD
jgi:nicotinamidase-related amidase